MTDARLLVAIGPDLVAFRLRNHTVLPTGEIVARAPAPIQDVWLHGPTSTAYIASSDCFRALSNGLHHLTAFALRPDLAGSRRIGTSQPLPFRPISIALDRSGRHLVAACSDPALLTIHPIAEDGAVGPAIRQAERLDPGLYPHHVQILPSGRTVLLVTRGKSLAPGLAPARGALKTFSLEGDQLAGKEAVTPENRVSFSPRQAARHPTKPWLYVVLERENEVHMYAMGEDDRLGSEPIFVRSTLSTTGVVHQGQAAGAIRISADGRFAFIVNRADGVVRKNGRSVFAGGENSVAVFAIDPATGEPTMIEAAETRSHHVRVFAIEPRSGTLVAASIRPMAREIDGVITTIPAKLTAFRMERDGRLTWMSEWSVDPGDDMMFWCGVDPAAGRAA
jgi:6-phosphogluconolactonase